MQTGDAGEQLNRQVLPFCEKISYDKLISMRKQEPKYDEDKWILAARKTLTQQCGKHRQPETEKRKDKQTLSHTKIKQRHRSEGQRKFYYIFRNSFGTANERCGCERDTQFPEPNK